MAVFPTAETVRDLTVEFILSQVLVNVIKNLAKAQKKAVGKMLSDCNLSVNTLSSMQSGGYYPRVEAISKIADYLDCSVDYLLGRTDVPEINKGQSFKIVTDAPRLTAKTAARTGARKNVEKISELEMLEMEIEKKNS